jgi:hypothetical protein
VDETDASATLRDGRAHDSDALELMAGQAQREGDQAATRQLLQDLGL